MTGESVEQAALRRAANRDDPFAEVLAALEGQTELNRTVLRALHALLNDNADLWDDNARLRDELHEAVGALSGRIEGLTRMVQSRTDRLA